MRQNYDNQPVRPESGPCIVPAERARTSSYLWTKGGNQKRDCFVCLSWTPPEEVHLIRRSTGSCVKRLDSRCWKDPGDPHEPRTSSQNSKHCSEIWGPASFNSEHQDLTMAAIHRTHSRPRRDRRTNRRILSPNCLAPDSTFPTTAFEGLPEIGIRSRYLRLASFLP